MARVLAHQMQQKAFVGQRKIVLICFDFPLGKEGFGLSFSFNSLFELT